MSSAPALRGRIAAALDVLKAANEAAHTRRLTLVAAAAIKAAGGEGWAEEDPALPRIETASINGLLVLWQSVETRTLQALGLPVDQSAKAGEEVWRFDAIAQLRALLELEQAFIGAAGSDDGPLVRQAFAAWLRGIENARDDLGEAAVDVGADARRAYRASIAARGMEMVRNVTARAYRRDIVQALLAGDYDGMNPKDVARKLRQRFGAHDYDWERLARSEIAMAQVDGKRAEFDAAGITRVDYLTAQDGRVSTICRNHAANGPYPIAVAPVPVRDSHPGCRCTWRPVID